MGNFMLVQKQLTATTPQPGVTHVSLEDQAWTSHSLWHWTQMDTHSTRRTGASPYSSQRDEVGGFLEEVAP